MQPQSSNEKNRESAITYTGVGANLDDAKTSAIRSALSIQIPQYVIADRKVVNSELERDVTISTMSGYITSFEIIDQYKDANGFVVVTALIDVSEKKIRNYASRFEVISANQVSDRFDGENIANQILAAKRKKEAEEARKTQQYSTARKLAERLFAIKKVFPNQKGFVLSKRFYNQMGVTSNSNFSAISKIKKVLPNQIQSCTIKNPYPQKLRKALFPDSLYYHYY